MTDDRLRFETRAIHAGQDPDATYGSVNVPIYQTSTYAQPEVGSPKVWDYARGGNPTREAFQQALASLEGGERGFAFASGLGAETTLLLTLRPGDHVVLADDVYGGTYRLLSKVLARWGLGFSTVDLRDVAALSAALGPTTRLVWIETPSNPLLKIVDIAAVTAVAHEHGARVVVDNTFATPALQRPLALGADAVVHSVTKYIGGHSDLIGGAIVTSDEEWIERLSFLVNAVGAVPGPMDSYLALRGLKTLAVRMRAHSAGAGAVAGYLRTHPAVTTVLYPGSDDHPGHDVAARQMAGFGGMVSFRVRSAEKALDVARRTRLFFLAESLGGVESLIEVPGPMTHASVAGSPLAVPADLVRLSVGIEHPDDLIEDLDQALS
ncbi:MAG TPA: cystathionine gamma-synthase [Actinomycetota bacterium]|jgi:cystathionine beta-lyase/cystathionine gamma-synthase|nr:cystathionine gamma-synthase [Actinomycetota bacterium]